METCSTRRVVGPVDPVVRPADRQLPADVRLGLQRLPALPQRQDVQRAARAAGEARPVQEDAGAVDPAGLPVAVLVDLGPSRPAAGRRRRGTARSPGSAGPRARRPASRRPRRRSARPACSSRRSPRPASMPWQPLPKMQFQREVSQVRSQRKTCSSSAGSGNSTQARGKSSATSSATTTVSGRRFFLDFAFAAFATPPSVGARGVLPVRAGSRRPARTSAALPQRPDSTCRGAPAPCGCTHRTPLPDPP